jgi:hypothetical protein
MDAGDRVPAAAEGRLVVGLLTGEEGLRAAGGRARHVDQPLHGARRAHPADTLNTVAGTPCRAVLPTCRHLCIGRALTWRDGDAGTAWLGGRREGQAGPHEDGLGRSLMCIMYDHVQSAAGFLMQC